MMTMFDVARDERTKDPSEPWNVERPLCFFCDVCTGVDRYFNVSFVLHTRASFLQKDVVDTQCVDQLVGARFFDHRAIRLAYFGEFSAISGNFALK
jgi:hypothetical protein